MTSTRTILRRHSTDPTVTRTGGRETRCLRTPRRTCACYLTARRPPSTVPAPSPDATASAARVERPRPHVRAAQSHRIGLRRSPWPSPPSASTTPSSSCPTSNGRCASTPSPSAWTSSPGAAGQRRLPAAAPIGQPPRPRPLRRRWAKAPGLHRPVPPRLAGRHHRRSRPGPSGAGRHGAYTGKSSHGATKSIYGADPDGNDFEIMWMLPPNHWGAYEHVAPVDHLDLTAEVRRWSGVRTAGQIAPEPVESES